MTIGTLEYIHRIMQEDKQRKSDALAEARRKLREKREAIENGAKGDDGYETDAKDWADREFTKARDALNEFEAQEW